jgi:hypothetical protein
LSSRSSSNTTEFSKDAPSAKPALQSRATSFRAEIEHVALAPDHRIGKVDFNFGAETGRMGPQFTERVTHLDLYRLEHLDEPARCGLRNNAGLIDRGDERGGTAVHDRNFRTIDFDRGVIDAHAAQRGEHMLGGRDQRAVAVAQHGGKFGCDDGFSNRLNFAVGTIQPGTDKNKTCIDRRRPNGQTDRQSRMNADARHSGLRPKRCLPAKFHSKPAQN